MLPDEKRKLWDLRFGMLSEPLQIEVVVRISRCPPSMFMVWICYSGICCYGLGQYPTDRYIAIPLKLDAKILPDNVSGFRLYLTVPYIWVVVKIMVPFGVP